METEQTTVEPEDEEENIRGNDGPCNIPKVQEQKTIKREKARISKAVNPTKSISRLHSD